MKFTFQPESKPLDGYTIKRAIHRGGFGEVYYAISDAGKEVALKLLRQHLDVELRGLSQCLNLKHPNLVTIFDIRTDADGDHWVVMEYISGKGLNHLLQDHPEGMPLDEVRRWLEGLSTGLTFLHDRGIVHRDLKPANLFLEHGTVKIGDVGLSKFISESHRSAQTQSVGTVYYMAPEVAHGRYGREVDIYSLGVILYELLTGRIPFDGESAGEILMKHLSEKPDLGPIPKRLRPVVGRALEKDPMRRTASAAQLLDEFNRAVAGLELSTVQPPASWEGRTLADTSTFERENDPFDSDVQRRVARDVRDARHYAKNAARQARRLAHEARRQTRHRARREKANARRPRRSNRRAAAGGAYAGPPPVGGCGYANPNDQPASHRTARSNKMGLALRWIAVIAVLLLIWAPSTLFRLMGVLFFVGIYGGIGYGIYRLILLLTGSASRRPRHDFGRPADEGGADGLPFDSPRAVPPVHDDGSPFLPAVHAERRPSKRRADSFNPNTLRTISMRQRITELTGSLTFAAICTALITAGVHSFTSFFPDSAAVGLFAGTTLLGSWGILTISKLWEGHGDDSSMRRLTLLGLGALVGCSAYWMDEMLMVTVPFQYLTRPTGLFDTVGPHRLFDGVFQPTLAGYVIFFSGLFAARRWWWHADSFRKRRFRLVSVLLTVGLGYVLAFLFSFPQVWGMTWAAAISSIVHLSATWVPLRERAELVEAEPTA